MKSAKDVAIDAVREAFGMTGFSRETFVVMMNDKGETGSIYRKAVEAVERAIEMDRKASASLRAPS
jgi:hypothetical protein